MVETPRGAVAAATGARGVSTSGEMSDGLPRAAIRTCWDVAARRGGGEGEACLGGGAAPAARRDVRALGAVARGREEDEPALLRGGEPRAYLPRSSKS
jgi:hypothetical protein